MLVGLAGCVATDEPGRLRPVPSPGPVVTIATADAADGKPGAGADSDCRDGWATQRPAIARRGYAERCQRRVAST